MVMTPPKPQVKDPQAEEPQENPISQGEERNPIRYPNGCPIQGHEGYGCTCNPIPGKRA